jgi:voltage-gated potassium channel
MNTPALSPESGDQPQRRAGIRLGVFRHAAIGLLGALALLFVSAPLVEDLPHGDVVEAGLLTLVMVLAVLAVGGRGRTLVIALLLVTPALAGKWINHLRPDLLPPFVFIVATMAFFTFAVAHLLRFILRARRVDANVLCAGISGYLMLGLLWMPAYLLIARLSPTAFSLTVGPDAGRALDGFNAFYFSFITLCTVGYGDVVPISRAARMLAVMEAITGLFYVAVLISRLVAVYSSVQPAAEADSKGKPS